MKRNRVLSILAFSATLLLTSHLMGQQQKKPNIIFILADDLGYGDVKSFNPDGKIATPNIDQLSAQGMRFIDAHSSSAVCSPSRYSILTGRYNWRSTLQSGVLSGNSKPIIHSNTPTVAQMLKSQGYSTAAVGKWHLGWDWAKLPAGQKNHFQGEQNKAFAHIDYSKPIQNGPTTLGFDYFFGIAASLDIPPYLFIQNDRVAEIPTISRSFSMQKRIGPTTPDFEPENVLPTLTEKAQEVIIDRAKSKAPFFLYFALPSPHTPIAPSKQFQGKSGVTAYGDYVEETDWSVGQVMKTLDSLGIADNTLVVFTSDNGFAPYVLPEYNVEALGHFPSYIFRGYKSDIWEGGHHVPMIVRWPAKVKAGTVSTELISLTDFMATCADVLHYKMQPGEAVDSYSFLSYLMEDANAKDRPAVVLHSIYGNFAIQQGKWKLEFCPGSGGWEAPKNKVATQEGLPSVQLYDMSIDARESYNLANQHPDIIKNLTHLMETYITNGRSTPGPKEKNDVSVDLWKANEN